MDVNSVGSRTELRAWPLESGSLGWSPSITAYQLLLLKLSGLQYLHLSIGVILASTYKIILRMTSANICERLRQCWARSMHSCVWGLRSGTPWEAAQSTRYGRWFWHLLLSENFVTVAVVKPKLAGSFMGVGEWEGLCKAQEVGLENFSSPFHLHLTCSGLSHVVFSWFSWAWSASFRSAPCSEPFIRGSPELLLTAWPSWGLVLVCFAHLHHGMQTQEWKTRTMSFLQFALRAEPAGVPWDMRNSKFGDEIHI